LPRCERIINFNITKPGRPTISQQASPIALDATYSAGDSLSGVGVYSRELLYGLARLRPYQPFLWCYRPHRYLKSLQIPLPERCSRRLLWESRPPQGILFHALNQRLPKKKLHRSAVTFHDLFVMTGEYSTPEFRSRFAAQAQDAAERADLIIAVSAYTASQVEDLLKVPRERIRVVWHGVHPPAAPPPPLDRREKMVLHVGAIQLRKNVVRLVEAFEQMDADWTLTLAGGEGYGAARIMERIRQSPASRRIKVLGYVSNVQLKNLYTRAAILAFPSLDEGFGIPVLEAMAYGVPVVASNRSALKEVAGQASIQVNPLESEDIAMGLKLLGRDAGLREELIHKGFTVAQQNTWDVATLKTWKIYEELLV
jgi:glycosyltransferase involved in cell wall biosynthesis